MEMHRAIEGGAGFVIALLPFLLRYGFQNRTTDFSNPSIIVCLALGGLAAALGFAGTRERRDAFGSSHGTFDRGLLVALVIATIVFALRGEVFPVLLLGGAALVYGVLITFTRFTALGV